MKVRLAKHSAGVAEVSNDLHLIPRSSRWSRTPWPDCGVAAGVDLGRCAARLGAICDAVADQVARGLEIAFAQFAEMRAAVTRCDR